MIKDFFISFRDNIRQKTTNPFFGTFIIVWTIRNWKLVYSFVTIESHKSLDDRIKYIEQYFSKESFFENLMCTALWSFGILIASYILLNASRLIVNFFEKIITPIIYKWTDKGDIVLKKDYELMLKENERLKEKFENERELKVKAQRERDEYEARILNLNQSNSMSDKPKDDDDTEERRILNRILESPFADKFEYLIAQVGKGGFFHFDEKYIDFFLALGLIELKSRGSSSSSYKFT